jgi:hypothetical protein
MKSDTAIIKLVTIITVIMTEENYNSQYAVLATSKNEMFIDDILVCDGGTCGHYCNSSKGLINVEKIR